MSDLVVIATLFGAVITGLCAVLTAVSIKTSKDIKTICADTKTIVRELRDMKVHMRQLHEEHKGIGEKVDGAAEKMLTAGTSSK